MVCTPRSCLGAGGRGQGESHRWRRLPEWPSPGPRFSMVGSFTDNILADAIVKNIGGFNATLAYQARCCVTHNELVLMLLRARRRRVQAIRQDAFVAPPAGQISGRICLQDYINLGCARVTA